MVMTNHGIQSGDLNFFPRSGEELELEPMTRARSQAFAEELADFRTGGPLQEPAAVRKLSEYFRLQHIYHSTGIEGNRLTMRETEAVLLHGLEINDAPLSDQHEVRDLDAAFSFLEECARRGGIVREIDLREMHRLVVGQTQESDPGKYRSIGVTITGSEHRPPEPIAVPSLMQNLTDWLNSEKNLAPVVFAAIAHHKLVAIHPFVDGNGRVARLLMNLLLMRAGHPIANIKREDRPRYYDALTYADLTFYSPLVDLVLDRTIEVFAEMKRIRAETERAKEWAARWGHKEEEVLHRREEREYRIWLGQMENVRLEFESRADMLSDHLQTVRLEFRAYPPPDLTKYQQLREKGRASQTWFFSVNFRSNDGSQKSFFFRFYRDYAIHGRDRVIPLQLNWFVDEEPAPVDNPRIRLRELYFDAERRLCTRTFENNALCTTDKLPVGQVVEQFYEDVLKNCLGITV